MHYTESLGTNARQDILLDIVILTLIVVVTHDQHVRRNVVQGQEPCSDMTPLVLAGGHNDDNLAFIVGFLGHVNDPCIGRAVDRLLVKLVEVLALDLAWPNGIQEELSAPVAVLLDESAEMIALASGAGYRCFTSAAAFRDYIEKDILALEKAA